MDGRPTEHSKVSTDETLVETEMTVFQRVFAGYLDSVPKMESSVVKVFLSSTPTDMLVERSWLLQNAVPYLRRYCKERGLEFEALLGDKYGHRPLPTQIELTEFKLLKNTAMKLGHDVTPLLTWYRRDDSTEPPMYIMQPLSTAYSHIHDFSMANLVQCQQEQRDWNLTSQKLLDLFRASAEYELEQKKITKETKHKYFRSVVDQEVTYGILAAPATKNKVISFQRTFVDMDLKAEVVDRYTDMLEEGLDMDVEELRERLRLVKIPTILGPAQLKKYNVPWSTFGLDTDNNLNHINYLHTFGEDFVSAMETMINAGLAEKPSVSRKTPLFREVAHHLHMCRKFVKISCDFDDILDAIQSKISFFYGTADIKSTPPLTSDNTAIADDRSKTMEMIEEQEETRHINTGGRTDDNTGCVDIDGNSEDPSTPHNVGWSTDEANAERIRSALRPDSVKSVSTVERLTQLGVSYVIGDTSEDVESDPNINMKEELLALPRMSEYTKPLFLYGKHGSGKSTLIARIMELSKIWFPGSVSIIRFLGTSTMSSSIREVLVSLCLQIWAAYSVTRPTGVDLDGDFNFLVEYFTALLWKVNTRTIPLVILLDSVGKLSPSDQAYSMTWLPRKLPPNVHIILSMEKHKHNCLKNAQTIFPESDQYVIMPEVTSSMVADMMTHLCVNAKRKLARRHRIMLMEKFESYAHPLYVRLLTTTAFSWHSYDEIDKDTLGSTLTKSIHVMFDHLEAAYGTTLVSKAIGYMSSARDGLTELELADILSLDDEVLQESYVYKLPYDSEIIRVPILSLKRLLRYLESYLQDNDCAGTRVLTWQNQHFADQAKERYAKPEIKAQLHETMADYFNGTWSKKWKPIEFTKGKKANFPRAMRHVPEQPIRFTPNIFNVRKLSEQPYHLIHSHRFMELFDLLLSDCEWLYSKCHSMSLTLLMGDISMAIDTMETNMLVLTNLVLFTRIRLLFKILHLGQDSIRKDSSNLPVQLLSQLGPEFCVDPAIERLVKGTIRWCKEADLPILYPVRSCLPDPTGIVLYNIDLPLPLPGNETECRNRSNCKVMCLHDNTNQLFVLQRQNKDTDLLSSYDTQDIGCLVTTEPLNRHVYSLQFLGNFRYFLLKVREASQDGCSRYHDTLYETATSTPVLLPKSASTISASHTGNTLAYATDMAVMICPSYKPQMSTATVQLVSDNSDTLCVTALVFSPDEKYLLIEESGNKISVFDIDSLKRRCIYENCQFHAITSKITLICMVAREQNEIIILNLVTGISSSVLTNQTYDLIDLHPSLNCLLMGNSPGCDQSQKRQARLFDLESLTMFGHSPVAGPYSQLTIFGDERIFYVAIADGDLDINVIFAGNAENVLPHAVLARRLRGHSGPIRQIIVSKKLDQLYSVEDKTIKVWDLRHVTEVFKSDLEHIRMSTGSNDLEDIVSRYDRQEEEQVPVIVPTAVVLHEASQRAYVGAKDGRLLVYNLNDGRIFSSVSLDEGDVTHMILSRSSNHLIIAATRVVIWTIPDSTYESLSPRKPRTTCLAESNNVLVVGHSGTASQARVWNILTGEIIRDIDMLYSFTCVAINILGTAIVSTLFDFPVITQLADDNAGDINISKVDTLMASGVCVVISPNDKLAASASTDGSVRVIKMNGVYLFRMQQKSAVSALAFTNDSGSLLSAGFRSIYVWSVDEGVLRFKLTRHLHYISTIKFDPTGKFLVTASDDQQIIVWDFKRAISMATFQTHCKVKTLQVFRKVKAIAYIPEDIDKLGLIKPNRALRHLIKGRFSSVKLDPNAQAVALTFSGQRAGQGHRSALCSVM